MNKDGWQAVALFAIALRILTNAVQFYTRRVEAAELASKEAESYKCPEVVTPGIIEYHPAVKHPKTQNLPSVIVDPAMKCFGGTPMKKDTKGVWQQIAGSC